MSQQILSNITAILARLDRLEKANEALAAEIQELKQRPTPEPKTLHLDAKPGRQQAAGNGNN